MPTPSTPNRSARRLTMRERQVLALVAEGYSTAEIARALWITEDTVRTHIKRMMARLGARTRAHLVTIAFRERLWVERTSGGKDDERAGSRLSDSPRRRRSRAP